MAGMETVRRSFKMIVDLKNPSLFQLLLNFCTCEFHQFVSRTFVHFQGQEKNINDRFFLFNVRIIYST